jgi:N-acetylmuramoyl-L-alanine amidase
MIPNMRTLIKLVVLFILALPNGASPAEKTLTVKGVRYFSYAVFTRIVFEVESAGPYVLTKAEDGKGLMLAAYDMPLVVKTQLPVIKDGVVSGLETREDAGRTVIFVRLDVAAGEAKDFALRAPDRIVLDIARGTTTAPVSQPQTSLSQTVPSRTGRPVTVVLDPGHGGKDTGVVTAHGMEKAFTLDLALAVKKILRNDPRLNVVLTREKDKALSLDERAVVSNVSGASVFVSIHGTPDPVTRVYIQDVLEGPGATAARPPGRDFLGFEAGSEQQEMLWGKQQAAHALESGVLGRSLARQFGGKEDADPVQAPLAGLKAVDAAAVLIELGMTRVQSKAAEAVAKGIEQYVRQNR